MILISQHSKRIFEQKLHMFLIGELFIFWPIQELFFISYYATVLSDIMSIEFWNHNARIMPSGFRIQTTEYG